MPKTEIKKKSVILKPRITEKAAIGADKSNVYVFNVAKDSTKKSISSSIVETYKVTPTKVRVASVPSKNVFVRGKWGVKSGGKKAYVYLKKGDKIALA
jgi:large subunit ribosomal protein L23